MPSNFLAALFCAYLQKYRRDFERNRMRILGRVFITERPASSTPLFNDMNKTNYGGAVRYADDCA
jgi:hypothetical protein